MWKVEKRVEKKERVRPQVSRMPSDPYRRSFALLRASRTICRCRRSSFLSFIVVFAPVVPDRSTSHGRRCDEGREERGDEVV